MVGFFASGLQQVAAQLRVGRDGGLGRVQRLRADLARVGAGAAAAGLGRDACGGANKVRKLLSAAVSRRSVRFGRMGPWYAEGGQARRAAN